MMVKSALHGWRWRSGVKQDVNKALLVSGREADEVFVLLP
jgi:hypothetical protein